LLISHAVEGVTHGFALFGPHLVLHAPGQQQEAAENGARLMTVTKMLNRVLIIASLLRSCYQHWVARHRQNQVGGLVERSLAALAVGPDDDANMMTISSRCTGREMCRNPYPDSLFQGMAQ
jgi:hypothetical protein